MTQEETQNGTISIIIPVRNAADSIAKCVGSILQSDYPDLEVLIIDDGSDDRTLSLCLQLQQKYEQIRVLHQENKGVSAARNRGLDEASGKFVTFVDADDAVAPQMLSVLLELIRGNDIAGCGFEQTHAAAQMPALYLHEQESTMPEQNLPQFMAGEDFIRTKLLHGDTRIWSKLLRRSLIGEQRFQEGLTIGEDMLFLLSVLQPDTRIALTERKLYGYYVNPAGAMERPFTPSYYDQITCWELAAQEIQHRFPQIAQDPQSAAGIGALEVTAAMLTAGKLSALPEEQRSAHREGIQRIQAILNTQLNRTGVKQMLPEGYAAKAGLFQKSPDLYFLLYGTLKKMKTGKHNQNPARRGAAPHLVLYMHAGSGNHGCEAIVTGLLMGLYESVETDRTQSSPEVILLTNSAEEDSKYLPEAICDIRQEQKFSEHKIKHILYYLYRKVTKDAESFLRFRYQPAFSNGKPAAAVSIGGDNYCYPIMVQDLILSNRMFRSQGVKTLLLGCSIEPGLLRPEEEGGFPDSERGGFTAAQLLEDLGSYEQILARESLTYEALKTAVGEERLLLVPDPAFLMQPAQEAVCPEGFIPGRTVGINLSPMAESYEAQTGGARSACRALIRHILETTDQSVALIPHVVWERNDDRKVLEQLREELRRDLSEDQMRRVLIIPDQSARCLKKIISQCSLFVGARTHATIAAYSSDVPTLVLGYSIKALGIARDLFGESRIGGEAYRQEHFVLPVQELNEPEQLMTAYDWMYEHRDEVREWLKQIIPGYQARAMQNAAAVRKLL